MDPTKLETLKMTWNSFWIQWEPENCGMWRRLLDSSYDFKHSTAILQGAHRPIHLINSFSGIYIYIYSSLYSTPICSVTTSNTHIYCCYVVFFFFWLYFVFCLWWWFFCRWMEKVYKICRMGSNHFHLVSDFSN